MRHPQPALRVIAVLAVALAVAGGCSSGASSQAPASASAAASPAASSSAVDTAEAAAQLVLAQDPRFAGFGPLDPDLIGQCCWYEVTESSSGWDVLVHAGWGDCPAGCINKHEWGYEVSRTGEVRLAAETGDPLPDGDFGG